MEGKYLRLIWIRRIYQNIEQEKVNVFFIAENENRLQLVGARGLSASLDMKKMIGDALSLINGKGGGNHSFAQGGGEAIMSGKQLLQHLSSINGLFTPTSELSE